MRTRSIITLAAAPVVAACAITATAAGAAADGDSLATVRSATARYHRVAVAAAEGFVDTQECVVHDGAAMGVHHGNFARIDDTVDVAEPEVLLYEPSENGNRLVGVEYVAVAPLDEPPTLLGQTFDVLADNGDGTAVWALHVWAWRHNPAGAFAPFNPSVSCPSAS